MDHASALHRRTFPPEGDLHLRVLMAGWGTIGPWWRSGLTCHPFWIAYANEGPGAALALADGRDLPLRAGEVCLLPAWTRIASRCRRPVGHHWVHFDPVGLPPGAMQELCPGPAILPVDAALAGGLDALRAAALGLGRDGAGVELRCRAKALAYAVMAAWWPTLPEAVRSRLALAPGAGPLAPALDRIERDLAAPLYNQALALACGLSPAGFVRRFRAATGQSPAQFVLDRRIARAAERLLLGGESIDAIAAGLGFPDRYYFTRVFTRRMGCSPAAYRDQGPMRPAAARRSHTPAR